MDIAQRTSIIKQKAHELGFDFCGVAKAEQLQQEARDLEKWLAQGRHGTMSYMENHFDKRTDPRKLVDGAKSVITLLLNYFPEKELNTGYKVSKYAYGRDYHKVIKSKLKKLLTYINEEIGAVHGRGFVDSAPVMDKAWAKKAGLGWVGKHTNLIHPQAGSYYFVAELIVDLELEYDGPIKDYCGTCTKCIDACPTDAITGPYEIDGSKCISYLTIELKDNIPSSFKDQMDDWIFGCDVCQDVCPWNRFSTTKREHDFNPHPKLGTMQKQDWIEITEELFDQLFKGSAVKRTKYKGLQRNIKFVNNS